MTEIIHVAGARTVRCNFCDRTKQEVKALIQAPTGYCICDGCVARFKKLMDAPPVPDQPVPTSPSPSPRVA